MPHLRDILNEIKWTKELSQVEIWYLHRGAPNNSKKITGEKIVSIGKSFLVTTTATIPYHRIKKVKYQTKIYFDAKKNRGKKEK